MSTDYGEKERQFLATLKADTGRDVAEWMAAIAAENLQGRNEIIDWLRRQRRFTFSKASWIERIHNNGGRPLYENGGAPRKLQRTRSASAMPAAPAPPAAPPPPLTPLAASPPPAPPAPTASPSPPAAAPPPPAAPEPSATVIPLRLVPKTPAPAPNPPPAPAAPAAAAPPPPPAARTFDLETLLMKAKAFRPLANFVLAEIGKAVPSLVTTAASSYVVLSKGPQSFGVLTISAKELRLGLALKGASVEAPYQAVKLATLPAEVSAPLSHMAVLNDARQINEALIARVREAADRVG